MQHSLSLLNFALFVWCQALSKATSTKRLPKFCDEEGIGFSKQPSISLFAVHLHDDAGIDLDPALAFDIVSMLKATTRVFQTIQWVAADHISTEVYNQFDRVIIL
jgi:hypothetical protein